MTVGRIWAADQCRTSLANQRVGRSWGLMLKGQLLARSGRSGSDAATAVKLSTEGIYPYSNEASPWTR